MTEEQDAAQQLASNGESIEGPISREALYEMVWSEPMLKVGAKFGVSSSYMARVCTLLNVPRPERGYWAKLGVGKAPKKPALPMPRPGELLSWSRGQALNIHPARPLPQPFEGPLRRRRGTRRQLPDQHPLLANVRPLFEAGRLSWHGKYLKPAKKLLVDLVVTGNGLQKAIDFASQLFLALEAREHRVMISPVHDRFQREEVDVREEPKQGHRNCELWSPMRPTVVYVGSVAIGLTVIEMSEQAEARYVKGEYVRLSEQAPKPRSPYRHDQSWTSTHDFPTGRLCLQGYSPYPRAKWTRVWRETPARTISSQITNIVRELETATSDVARLVEEGERQAEIERLRWEAQCEKWRREEKERRAAKALKESQDELRKIIEAWTEAKRLHDFFADAEQHLEDLASEDRELIRERLQRARELVGSTDSLEQLSIWQTPEERAGD